MNNETVEVETIHGFAFKDKKLIQRVATKLFVLKGKNEDSDKRFLIDTGESVEEFEKIQQQIPSKNSLLYALVTHCHTDHTGNIQRILEFYPKCKIIMTTLNLEQCTETTDNCFSTKLRTNRCGQKNVEKYVKLDEMDRVIEYDRMTLEQKILLVEIFDVYLFKTPGHTKCDLCAFQFSNRRKLSNFFIGDLVMMLPLPGIKNRIFLPLIQDKRSVLINSLRRICNISPNNIYVSHYEENPITVGKLKKDLNNKFLNLLTGRISKWEAQSDKEKEQFKSDQKNLKDCRICFANNSIVLCSDYILFDRDDGVIKIRYNEIDKLSTASNNKSGDFTIFYKKKNFPTNEKTNEKEEENLEPVTIVEEKVEFRVTEDGEEFKKKFFAKIEQKTQMNIDSFLSD